MGGGGGKGGSTTQEVSIPSWLEDAAKSALARGEQTAGIGFAPYQGPDVAALTPMQEASMFNTSQASSAFGLGPSPAPGAGMPTVQTFADGTRGYSSFPIYEQAVNALRMRDPAQYAKLTAPFSGAPTYAPAAAPMSSNAGPRRDPNEPRQGSASSRNTRFDTPAQSRASGPPTRQQAGYSGVKDMFDGGGPRASGAKKGKK